MKDFTHAQARFRELLKQLIAEQGGGRGSKRAVAQATGLDPSHLSRLISGNPPPVGQNLMMAVAGRLEISSAYFSSPGPTDYRSFKLGHKAEPATEDMRATVEELRLRVRRLEADVYAMGGMTGFDKYFERRMHEPTFAASYAEERKAIDDQETTRRKFKKLIEMAGHGSIGRISASVGMSREHFSRWVNGKLDLPKASLFMAAAKYAAISETLDRAEKKGIEP